MMAGLFLCCPPALAQVESDEGVLGSDAPIETGTGVTTYVASFFLDANPANARDMVNRLPGFSFNGGNSTRGFTGSAGNVLIDGAVASTRSVSLDEILRRIPVSNVERIEVIRGGAPGIDMQGFPVVANVVRRSGSVTAGAIESTPSVNQRGNYEISARGELSYRTDSFSFEGAVEAESDGFGGSDGTQSRFDRFRNLRDSGRYIDEGYENSYEANGIAEYRNDFLGTFRFNGAIDTRKERSGILYFATDPAGVTTLRANPSTERSSGYEFGADYEGDFFDGYTATLLGLYRRSFPIDSSFNLANNSESGRKTPNGETILRTTLRNEFLPWLTLQAGAEGALNFRDTKSFLTINGVPQILPNANVRVEESRGEFSGTANVTFWPELRGEFGMRYETSVISQLGDTNRDRAFTFGKPRAILTYDLQDDTQLRLRLERRVGQLDFGSFAASNDLVLGTVTAGNANLEPERSWEHEIAIEHRFWQEGSITLAFLHSDVEKINDRIVVVTPTQIFDAPGNIGDGTRDRVTLNGTVPFDEMGLEHFRVQFQWNWNWSEVTDPVTGVLRGTSNEYPSWGNVTLTQDVPDWGSTFGVTANIDPMRSNYLLREYRQEKVQTRLYFYWNWRARPDLLFNLSAENVIFKRERWRERTIFTTSRAAGDFSGSEILRTVNQPTYRLQIRKTF
jgi:outer membrane receptor protein involved in Fe transport